MEKGSSQYRVPLPCYVESSLPSDGGFNVYLCDSTKTILINTFICPLLVFIINYVGFPLPFDVHNCAPGIIPLDSSPKWKKITDVKGRKAADVKSPIKCSTAQKSLVFSFIFLCIPFPPPKCALGFYEPVSSLMIDLNALKWALPWNSLCKSQCWGDPILLLHMGFSSHWDSDFCTLCTLIPFVPFHFLLSCWEVPGLTWKCPNPI